MANRITYSPKTDNINAPESQRVFYAAEANEVASVVNSHADDIESIQAAQATPTASVGSYTSLTLLTAVFPTGANGAYGIIDAGSGATPQIALYDTDDNIWTITGAATDKVYVTSFANLPTTGIADVWYITTDNFTTYIWYNNQWNGVNVSNDSNLTSSFQNLIQNTANVSSSTLEYRLKNGRLILIGRFTSTSSAVGNQIIGVLPTGFRPDVRRDIYNDDIERVIFNTSGNVVANLTASTTYNLDVEFTLNINT